MNSTVQSIPAESQTSLQKSSYLSHTWSRLSALLNLHFSKPTVAANDDEPVAALDDEHEDMMNYR